MRKPSIIFAWLSIVSGFLFLSLMAFWAFYPYKIVTFKEPFRVLTPTVKRGENLIYVIESCKYIPIEAQVSKSFVDDIIYSVQTTVSNRPLGCYTSTIGLIVPTGLAPGKYLLQTIFHFKINPIRNIVIETKSEWFNVI